MSIVNKILDVLHLGYPTVEVSLPEEVKWVNRDMIHHIQTHPLYVTKSLIGLEPMNSFGSQSEYIKRYGEVDTDTIIGTLVDVLYDEDNNKLTGKIKFYKGMRCPVNYLHLRCMVYRDFDGPYYINKMICTDIR